MPPEDGKDVCTSSEGSETTRLVDAGFADQSSSRNDENGKSKKMSRLRVRRLPIKHVVKLLVFLDMLSVALVIPLLSSYFRDLSIRCCDVVGWWKRWMQAMLYEL